MYFNLAYEEKSNYFFLFNEDNVIYYNFALFQPNSEALSWVSDFSGAGMRFFCCSFPLIFPLEQMQETPFLYK